MGKNVVMTEPAPNPILNHPAVVRVRAALARDDLDPEIVIFDDHAKTAAIAAEKLGIEVGQIANSLIFDADGVPLLVLTSGAHRVDLDKVKQVTGHTRISRASADFVREHTGQAIGGVAPVGHPAPVATLVDVWLDRYEQVWAAAGHANTVFGVAPAELLRITGGTPVDVEP